MRVLSRMLALGLLVGCQEYNVNKDDPATPVVTDTDQPEPEPEPEPEPTEPTPDIQVDRDEINFGTLPPTCDATQDLLVSNVGDADLVITDVYLEGYANGAFTNLGSTVVLAPNESTTMSIEFAPATSAEFFDALTIESNDPDETQVQVTIIGEGDVTGQIEESFVQEGSPLPVDILFVIDNSTSMGDENLALRNNFNTFMQGFLTLNLDYQIGVVTTDMQTAGYQGQLQGPLITTATPNPVQQFAANADIPFTDVMEEQGLDAVNAALTAPLINGANAGLVRADSLLSVIVISDEDDQSVVTPQEMITLLDNYHNDPSKTSLSIVGGPRQGLFPCGNPLNPFTPSASPVPLYWEVAQATGGIHLNLCQLDMNQIVQQLAVVAAGLDTEFPLNNTPPDPSVIEVLVDNAPVTEDPVNGWQYDAGTNSIVFAGSGVPPAGSTIRVVIPDVVGCP